MSLRFAYGDITKGRERQLETSDPVTAHQFRFYCDRFGESRLPGRDHVDSTECVWLPILRTYLKNGLRFFR